MVRHWEKFSIFVPKLEFRYEQNRFSSSEMDRDESGAPYSHRSGDWCHPRTDGSAMVWHRHSWSGIRECLEVHSPRTGGCAGGCLYSEGWWWTGASLPTADPALYAEYVGRSVVCCDGQLPVSR